MKAEENLKARGTQLKIGNDIAYANYIEDKIVNEDYSPVSYTHLDVYKRQVLRLPER